MESSNRMFSDHSGIEALNAAATPEPMFDITMVQLAGLAKQLKAMGAQVDTGVLCASLATGNLTAYLDKVEGASREQISRCVAHWFDGCRIAELN